MLFFFFTPLARSTFTRQIPTQFYQEKSKAIKWYAENYFFQNEQMNIIEP